MEFSYQPDEEALAQGIIADGIRLYGVQLGGKSTRDAYALLQEQEEALMGGLPKFALQFSDETLEQSPYELGLRLDLKKILDQAMAESGKTKNRHSLLTPSFRIEETAFSSAMNRIKETVDQEGRDAQATGFDAEKETFIFEKEKEGRILDLNQTQQVLQTELKALIDKGQSSTAGKTTQVIPVQLSVELTAPGRTADELKQYLGFVVEATTPILAPSVERNTNVRLAAERINGSIVLPGESFSYNKTIGPMTEENGFVPAGVQDDEGNDDKGIGGGLCQPSTTLYQAAVRANMKIDVHNFHTTPVTYCEIGTDAMVSDWSDLVFTNTTDYPYAIVSEFDGVSLTFKIYGPQNPDQAVIDFKVEETDSQEVEGDPKLVEEPTLEEESSYKVKPRLQRTVKVYKTYTINGELRDTEFLYEHTYPGSTGVLAVRDKEKAMRERQTVIIGYETDQNGNRVPIYGHPTEETENLLPSGYTPLAPIG